MGSGLDSISFSDVSDVTDLSSMLIDDEADFSDSFVSASESGLDSISFSGAYDEADMSSGISSMSMDNEADFSDVSYQSASDSALLSDIDNAPYSDYSTPGRAYQSASSYLSVSEEETDMEEPDLDDDFEDDDDEEEDEEVEEDEPEVDAEEEDDEEDDEDDDEEFDEENDDEDDDDDEDDEVEQDNDVEIYRNVDVAVVPEDQNNIYDSLDYSRIESINDFDDNSFYPRSFITRNSRPVWTIKDEPLSMFDYDSYETHHWVIIASVIVTLLTFLAYYLVFRKNGKLHHLAPSSRSRKKKYEQIDADVYNEDEDTDSYTYDDEYALDNKT